MLSHNFSGYGAVRGRGEMKGLGWWVCKALLFFLFFGINLCVASEMTLVPSLKLRGEYNDNILFSRLAEWDDYIGTVSPQMVFKYRTELANLESGVGLDYMQYADHDELNTTNQRYYLRGTYQTLERLRFRGDVSYIKDTTLDSELRETGLVGIRSNRARFNISGGVTYQLSELYEIGFDYQYTDTRYDWYGNVDYVYHMASMSLNHMLSNQRDVITLQPYYSYMDSEASTVDNYGFSIGWLHDFSEIMHLTFFFGVRYTDTDYYLVQPTVIFDPSVYPPFRLVYQKVSEKDDSWGGVADISLRRDGETFHWKIGYDQDLAYSSYGEPIDRKKGYFNLYKDFSRRLGGRISASYYRVKSDGDVTREDRDYFDIRPALIFKITENHTLECVYNYSHEHNRNVSSNKNYDRNRVWISLNFNFPKKW